MKPNGEKMNELLTAAQMRAIEEAAIASGKVTGLELMERAGQGVVDAVLEEWPDLRHGGHRAVVLCGPGNNGGDGFVVARLLMERGWEVAVYLYGDAAKLPPDARVNYERWSGMGEVRDIATLGDGGLDDFRAAILLDALFGTGLGRPITGLEFLLRDVIDCVDGGVGKPNEWGFERRPCVVAVDVPSGMCADSGRGLYPAAANDLPRGSTQAFVSKANLTVTFHRPKTGHFVGYGPEWTGKLRVVDIGLNGCGEAPVRLVGHYPVGKYDRYAHKYAHGHALVLSGPSGRGGAARLAARGALRIGAGVVTVGCPPDAVVQNAARLDAVMLRPVADAAALDDMLGDARINALCLGPALGTGPREAGLVAAALAAGRATVLDADALTLLAREGALFSALHGACVLTPHAGEFARLFPDIAAKLDAVATKGPAYSKVDAAREAAARAGCVVLFKGPDTVIAGPDGRCAINSAHYDRAAPWLATAGAGDVLAGFIAGLLARGFSPFDAACTGAWLHVECARDFGPGLIAEDLPEMLPAVFRRLGG